MNKIHQTLLVVAAAGGLLSALLSLYGQAHYVSRQEWSEEIKANEAAHRSIGDSLADIQLTNATGEVTGTVPGGLIDSVFGLFRSNKPAASGSPAAPAAAAAAPDAYAGLDSTGVAMASAGEDLAKRHGHISGRARGGFPDRAPPSDRLDR